MHGKNIILSDTRNSINDIFQHIKTANNINGHLNPYDVYDLPRSKLGVDLTVEARHATVKMLLLIYGRLDGRALRVGKPISFSARC